MLKIAIVYDVHVDTERGRIGWAYYNRARALQSYAPDDMHIEIMSTAEFMAQLDSMHVYDLLYMLDYMCIRSFRMHWDRLGLKTPLVSSYNRDSQTRQRNYEETVRLADFVVCNNEERWRAGGIDRNTCCISNGVDADFWTKTVPLSERKRILWCGSSNPKKMKRYADIIVPLGDRLESLGYETSFRPIDHIDESVLTPEEQRDWYNTGLIAVCASSSEGGGPSYMLEGTACGCVPVTTLAGSIPEWIDDVGIVVDGSLDSFVNAIQKVERNLATFESANRLFIERQAYGPPGNRASHFYDLFRRLAAGEIPEPFTYRDQ